MKPLPVICSPDDAVVKIEYGKTATVKMHNEKIDVPQTGDFSNSTLWIVIASASAIGIVACATALYRKRRKTTKEKA